MANFAVTREIIVKEKIENVMSATETYLETIDNAKTIILCQVVKDGMMHKALILHT